MNRPADLVSHVQGVSWHSLLSSSHPYPILWDVPHRRYTTHSETKQLINEVVTNSGTHINYAIRDGILFFKDKVCIPNNSALIPLLLAKFHTTLIEGHAGVQRTLARINNIFHWPGLVKAVCAYVLQCPTCQVSKPFNRAPQGLLQPLLIPRKIWHSISMDFIIGFSSSGSKTMIVVVIDHLSKYAHFTALGPNFTAPPGGRATGEGSNQAT